MAAGLAIAAPAVGDVAQMVAQANRAFITAPGDEDALGLALAKLAGDAALRAHLGAANRALAQAQFDENLMISTYRRTYAGAMGLAGLP